MEKVRNAEAPGYQDLSYKAPEGESYKLIQSAIGVLGSTQENRSAPESHSYLPHCRPLSSGQSSNSRSAPESLPVGRTAQAAASSGRFPPARPNSSANRGAAPD